MNGLELLLGHLVGDYIFQNDWMATNKTKSILPCFVHCCFYTFACWIFAPWLSWIAFVIIFAIHFPIDRFRLAGWWMKNISYQKEFATGALAPWSIIIVDNIFHLITLYFVSFL